jgi:hypothetical protein
MDVRKESCQVCPYRRDVPSGVWAAVEYEKLAEYDRETAQQPPSFFGCHATPEHICHGWAVVHGRQGPGHELLGLRLLAAIGEWDMSNEIPPEGTPLFSSGGEACEHGKRDIENPSPEALRAVRRLADKYERLQWS